jgi:hypothetical protein
VDQCKYSSVQRTWYCTNMPKQCATDTLCENKACDPIDGQCKVVWQQHCGDTDGNPCTIPTCNPITGQCIVPEPPTCGLDSTTNRCTHIYCNASDGSCVDAGEPICFLGLNVPPCKTKRCDPMYGCYLVDKCPPVTDQCHTGNCDEETGECIVEEKSCDCSQIPHDANECIMCSFDEYDQDCCDVHVYVCDDQVLFFLKKTKSMYIFTFFLVG